MDIETGLSLAGYGRFVLSLLAVVGLMLALGWVLRRVRDKGLFKPLLPGGAAAVDAPAVLSHQAIDIQYKLVTIRWQGRDHLVILGPQQQTLLESVPAPDAAHD